MRTIEQIRHARLLQLLSESRFPTIQSLADRIGRSHAQVSQWKNQSERRDKSGEVIGVSNIDSASARMIEKAAEKPVGWMDNDPVHDKNSGGDSQTDARDFSDSEWSLLSDLRVMPDDELKIIKEKAAKNREHLDRVFAQRQAKAVEDRAHRSAFKKPLKRTK